MKCPRSFKRHEAFYILFHLNQIIEEILAHLRQLLPAAPRRVEGYVQHPCYLAPAVFLGQQPSQVGKLRLLRTHVVHEKGREFIVADSQVPLRRWYVVGLQDTKTLS